ncbi:hypothetical protein H920_17498 [Fukomys damarensis]|uniref:Uncharacterized protein n=1 Tax=Fukomys damarensis TaxID=885580 RepID=A0A091CU77_FUKDA|nr:hypothetical protein H920_17498 [Fukomys damarensis]
MSEEPLPPLVSFCKTQSMAYTKRKTFNFYLCIMDLAAIRGKEGYNGRCSLYSLQLKAAHHMRVKMGNVGTCPDEREKVSRAPVSPADNFT